MDFKTVIIPLNMWFIMALRTKESATGPCTAPSGICKFKNATEIGKNASATKSMLHTKFGLAIWRRNLDSATRCIADGADPNAMFDGIPDAINQGLWTMFSYACHHALSENDAHIVRAMLERCRGVGINAIDIEGKTPLMLALENSNKEVAGLILKYDVDVRIKDNEGKTALVHAIKNCNGIGIIAMILEKGADANATDNCGRTPMMWASDSECAAALIASRAEMNARDANGRSVLGHAIGSLEFCKACLHSELEYYIEMVESYGKLVDFLKGADARE